MYVAPILVAVVITLIHFLGEKISEHVERFHMELLSFGAGLLIATFFLEILPQIESAEIFLGSYVYLAFLLGFVVIHLLEKSIYQHAGSERKIELDVTRFEAAGLTAYNLLVGLIVTVFFEAYGDLAYFILLPFFIRTFAISVSSSHINEKIDSRLNHLLQSISTVIGTFLGLVLIANKTQLFLVFSITMGLILYIVIRDMIPRGKEGKPIYFTAGALIAIATFLIFQVD